MLLAEVLAGVSLKADLPPDLAQLEVSGLEYDSRRVSRGNLFFAFEGQHADGRKFAADAIGRGALAVVSQSPRPAGFAGNWIEVHHGRQGLSLAARNFYGKPDERILVTGITGTNGKTTTCFLVDALLREAGNITALVGTIEYRLGARVLQAVNTTPESLDLIRLLAELDGHWRHARHDGSVLARAGTGPSLRPPLSHRDLHQSDARPSGFSPDDGDYFLAKQSLFEGAGAPPPLFAS